MKIFYIYYNFDSAFFPDKILVSVKEILNFGFTKNFDNESKFVKISHCDKTIDKDDFA